MFEIHEVSNESKKEFYESILPQIKGLIEGEGNTIANLANTSAFLNQVLTDINWVGFYLLEKDQLVLGPFQGKVACIRIPVGRGVCGSAVSENTIQLVPDVHAFEGHIACDAESQSEIVVPIRKEGKIVAVLDIDSPIKERFDQEDAFYLEQVVALLEDGCEWK